LPGSVLGQELEGAVNSFVPARVPAQAAAFSGPIDLVKMVAAFNDLLDPVKMEEAFSDPLDPAKMEAAFSDLLGRAKMAEVNNSVQVTSFDPTVDLVIVGLT
jgi:hypothetical protein